MSLDITPGIPTFDVEVMLQGMVIPS